MSTQSYGAQAKRDQATTMDSCKFPVVALLGEDLMCVDPVDGAQTLHRAIHHMNDGQVFMMGERLKLNVRTDRFAMRD